MDLISFLQGSDLRSIANADELVKLIESQTDFDSLFKLISSEDRLIKMRSIDAIEKITLRKPEFLQKYKNKILRFLKTAFDKEFKWQLVLIVSRII